MASLSRPSEGPTGVAQGVSGRLRARPDEYIETGRPLPSYKGVVSASYFARELGCRRSAIEGQRPLLTAAAGVVGVRDGAASTVTVRGLLDGEPWI
ncbi:hypothetical protein HEK616_84370 (plasmid) [Streptomyces nigrescens]|uniref:Uncharacterized protein n=1 Tax=Streptomyces nigrescens TaxID=1920 RepID=A0ABM8A890_STRNI|nr:hypothetical protein HEK616_84370 [Streptomyces nigrescens]